jgi:hypothetical protein
MKHILLPLLLSLSACSNCNIPYGEYESFGGSETATKLKLTANEYTLSFEHWKPSGYENREKINENGSWSCSGNTATISTNKGSELAKFQEIGKNPLSLPPTTKALVFKESGNSPLSGSILYPSDILE